MIGWIRLLEDEGAIVAGSGVALEGEVEAAIVVMRTLTLTFKLPLVAIISSRQEMEGGSSFLPKSRTKQLNALMSDQMKACIL